MQNKTYKIVKYIIIIFLSITLISALVLIYYVFRINSYHKSMKPFEFLSIYQTWTYVSFWGDSGNTYNGIVNLEKDENKKKLYFKYLDTNDKLENNYLFEAKNYVWYEMCYLNNYWEYCFWKVK